MMLAKETSLLMGMQPGCFSDPLSEVSLLPHCGDAPLTAGPACCLAALVSAVLPSNAAP